MTAADAVLRDVELSPELESSREYINFDHHLGFLFTKIPLLGQEVGQKTLLGFGISGWQQGTDEVEESFRGITDIAELDDSVLTLGRQGKGIGPRMYNTPQALAATAEQPSLVGMYAFSIDPDAVLDRRRPTDNTSIGKARRVLRHGGLKVASGLMGDIMTIQMINERQGDAEAVLYPQTPRGEWEKQRSQQPDSPVPEELMIVRRPDTTFLRVGEYHAAN